MIFDDIDRTILRELQKCAVQSIDELAECTGETPAHSRERIQLLIEHGVIIGYHTEIDLARIGRMVQGLIAVRLRTSANDVVDEFRTWMMNAPETVNLFATSGAANFFVHMAFPSTDSLYSFVTCELSGRPGVVDARTNVVFEHTKSHVIDPVDHEAPRKHRRGENGRGMYSS